MTGTWYIADSLACQRRRLVLPTVCWFLVLAFVVTNGQAQTPTDVVLAIETNTSDAVVYVDSTYLGSVSKRYFRVPATAGEVRLMAPYQASWSLRPVVRQIEDSDTGSVRQDTLVINASFPYSYRIESTPFGASVSQVVERARLDEPGELGITPFTLTRDEPLAGYLLVTKPGYEAVEIEPGAQVWNRHSVVLKSVGGLAVDRRAVAVEQPRRRRWIDAVSLGVAGGAAAVAIHYKFKADRRYDVYAENGDPELRPAIKRLDVRSGVALGVMQVGLGVFAIRMALR